MATFSEPETDRAYLNIKSIGTTRIVNRGRLMREMKQ